MGPDADRDGAGAGPAVSLRFEFEPLPGRVVFGAGRVADVLPELERLGARRAVLVASPGNAAAERLEAQLGARLAGRVERVQQHVPAAVADAARERVAALGGDALVALGGGSAIGVAKAVALTSQLPILAVPTTYAGSEMTSIWGVTEGSRKTTGRDKRVVARTVVYDPELTLTLSPGATAASGMNAVAHCAEALWATTADPVSSAIAEDGIRALATALPRAVRQPRDLTARTQALLGAYLAGTALGAVGTALHHKLAHVLGGAFALPHAEVHAVLLPYTTAYHLRRVPSADERIRRALGGEGATAIWQLARSLDVPAGLDQLGLTAAQAQDAARIAAESTAHDPHDLEELLEAAFHGAPPLEL